MRNRPVMVAVWMMSAVCASAEEQLRSIEMDFLDGRIDACLSTGIETLAKDPADAVARELCARALMRFGAYERAEALLREATPAAGLPIQACLADLRDAQGRPGEARAVRQASIAGLSGVETFATRELVALVNLCRRLGAFDAANQALQLAQDREPANPFVQLEKIRLYRATHGDTIAALTAKRLAAERPRCALAYAEWAETLWAMKENSEAVSWLCRRALELDPTLAAARNRLAYYALMADRRGDAQTLLAENLAVNAADAETLTLQRAMRVFTNPQGGPQETTNTPETSLMLAGLHGARGDYARALELAEAAHAAAPTGESAREAGLANFRMGRYPQARALLEQALRGDRYDLETANLLALVEALLGAEVSVDGPIAVSTVKEERVLGLYTATVARAAYRSALDLYGAAQTAPLRLHLCDDRDDLGVVTKGVPFGCACDASDPAVSGVVSFDHDVYLWTPSTALGGYRWDVAVHRAVGQAAVREASGNRAPQWIREGLAGRAAKDAAPGYQPPNLAGVLGWLASAARVTLEGMEEGLLGPSRPMYLTYAELVAEDWQTQFGDAKIRALLHAIHEGTRWPDALETIFAMPIEDLESKSRTRILDRYRWVNGTRGHGAHANPWRFDPSARKAAEAARLAWANGDRALAQKEIDRASHLAMVYGPQADDRCAIAEVFLDLGDTLGAATQAAAALDAAPLDSRHLGLYRRVIDATASMKPVPEVHIALLQGLRWMQPADADLRYELAQWNVAQGRIEEGLVDCRAALGIRPQWLDAHRFMARASMQAGNYALALPSLVVLHESRPKHVGVLEELVRCARALDAEQTGVYCAQLQELDPASPALRGAR